MKPLTPAQAALAPCIIAGWTRAQIAAHLGVRYATVKAHMLEIRDRLEPADMSRLADALIAAGYRATTEPPPPALPRESRGPATSFTEHVPADLVEEVRRLIAEGLSRREICARIGRTKKQLEYLMERYVGPSKRSERVEVRRPEARVFSSDNADAIVAEAIEAARRKPCAWL